MRSVAPEGGGFRAAGGFAVAGQTAAGVSQGRRNWLRAGFPPYRWTVITSLASQGGKLASTCPASSAFEVMTAESS
jgi:hypothetical protein